ncbi:MAG: ATP-binding protein [Actinomycetota bacterium]|nr:ATP-binding protein [Actinomycetota bacterium]
MTGLPWRATFAPDPSSVGRARVGLTDALNGSGVAGAVAADAMLLLGELAGNAVRHARTEFTVTATLADNTIRLEVMDLDTRPPSLVGVDVGSTSGRGLHLVSAVALDWGWHSTEDDAGVSGKVVWAELRSGQPGRSPT